MNDTLSVAILTSLSGLAGTALGAWITGRNAVKNAIAIAHLDLQKHTANRVWDEKLAVYRRIVTNLNAVAQSASIVDAGFNSPLADPYSYNTSDNYTKDVAELWGSWRTFQRNYQNDALIVSSSLSSLINQLMVDINSAGEDIPPLDYAEYSTIFENSTRKIIEAAKGEILHMSSQVVA